MENATARTLMTSDVVVVPPDASILRIASLLRQHRISAVPVVDQQGALIGIVTEADLMRRLVAMAEKPRSWFKSLFADPSEEADRYARAHGFVAEEVMTTDLVTVAPETPVAEIAALMEQRHVRRVLVVEAGRLCGIVSRADLLQALDEPRAEASETSDERIKRAVVAAMQRESWAYSPYTDATVDAGVVTFHGFSRDPAVQRGLRVLAWGVPGVKEVVDKTAVMPPELLYQAL
ncbi:CBS domain-containing protein [Sabulicella glaciei]|uniref:CBS domain-containing protein n=1 Tax=Sabulicella glaciei TaxID=2984948 RepID=A0ABT3P0A9_9PROT|nr:CBS domain-containing protein [Roseococcus sp. MDT2-1-1]MCW8087846.1 CBS domain-containing protein [Roseococcus sp. MDT2-1-1]